MLFFNLLYTLKSQGWVKDIGGENMVDIWEGKLTFLLGEEITTPASPKEEIKGSRADWYQESEKDNELTELEESNKSQERTEIENKIQVHKWDVIQNDY